MAFGIFKIIFELVNGRIVTTDNSIVFCFLKQPIVMLVMEIVLLVLGIMALLWAMWRIFAYFATERHLLIVQATGK